MSEPSNTEKLARLFMEVLAQNGYGIVKLDDEDAKRRDGYVKVITQPVTSGKADD